MGRPKIKNRERYPGGKAKPDNTMPVAIIHRFMELAAKECKQVHGPIGRMMMLKELRAVDVAAADHYARLRAAHDVAMGLPVRNARSPSYGAYISGGGQMDERAVEKAVSRYEALAGRLGKPACLLLDRVAICLEEPTWNERLILISVLERLAVICGLSEKK